MNDSVTAGQAVPHQAVEEVKARIAAAIEVQAEQLARLAAEIHHAPEVSFEEYRAAELVTQAICAAGYDTDLPTGSLPTAVHGRLRGRASDRQETSIAILAEYDALDGLGHGCGHNLMAAAGVGAAVGLAAVRDDFGGEVVFLGTPGEERGAGKQVMLDDGLFTGIDAALLFHPGDRTHTASPALALEDLTVTFSGKSAHAAAAPWLGRNALDAMIQLFSSIGLWRQQFPPGVLVHGVITDGGEAPNIIPSTTTAAFMVRAADEETFEQVRRRFRDLAEAAALATRCQVEVTRLGASSTMRDNQVLRESFASNLRARGIVEMAPREQVGSTDMGNVSQTLPAIQPHLAICDVGIPLHSTEFRAVADTPRAHAVVVDAAVVLAQTAYDLLVDPELVAAARAEFETGSQPSREEI